MLAGLSMFTLFAPTMTGAAAAVNSELVINQSQEMQLNQGPSFDVVSLGEIGILTMAFDVAYLPGGSDPILSEKEITLDVAGPIPRSEGNASIIKKGFQKTNRMKQSL